MRIGACVSAPRCFVFGRCGSISPKAGIGWAKLLKLPGAAAPTKARARALFAAGVLAVEQGDYASADALIRESLDIARQLGDKQGAAVSLNALAVNARDRGEVPLARSSLRRKPGAVARIGRSEGRRSLSQ